MADGKAKTQAAPGPIPTPVSEPAPMDEASLDAAEQAFIRWASAFVQGKASIEVVPVENPTFPNAGLAGGFSIRLGPISD